MLYVFFIVIVILFFLLPSTEEVYCSSTASEAKSADIVAYVYKALLALISFAVAAAVLYYGFAITRTLKRSKVVGHSKEKRARIWKVPYSPLMPTYSHSREADVRLRHVLRLACLPSGQPHRFRRRSQSICYFGDFNHSRL